MSMKRLLMFIAIFMLAIPSFADDKTPAPTLVAVDPVQFELDGSALFCLRARFTLGHPVTFMKVRKPSGHGGGMPDAVEAVTDTFGESIWFSNRWNWSNFQRLPGDWINIAGLGRLRQTDLSPSMPRSITIDGVGYGQEFWCGLDERQNVVVRARSGSYDWDGNGGFSGKVAPKVKVKIPAFK